MGRNDKDKWLGKLKDSVENHSEPLPDSFWEDIKRDIPATAPVVKRRKITHILMWPVAAAAVVLLGLVLLLPEKENVDAIQRTMAENLREEPHKADVEVLQAPVQVAGGVEKVSMNAGAANVALLQTPQERKPERTGQDNVAERLEQEQTVEHVVQVNGEVQAEQNKGQEHKTGEQKSEVVKKQKSQEVSKDKEREEFLRELEYLSEESHRNSGAGKRMMAFAVGNGGLEQFNPMQLFAYHEDASGLPLNDIISSDTGEGVKPSLSPGAEGSSVGSAPPGNFASYINMGGQPVEEITWLGGKSPAVFNNSATYKNYTYTHKEPVKLGLSFAMELGRGFYVESGMSYQYLASKMKSESISQKLHYVGIPVKVGVNFMRDRKFQVYLSGGYLVEKCVYGILEMPDKEDLKLKVKGVMNSLNVTAGLQLRMGNFTSLYLEPGLYRYLGMGEEIGREHGYILKNIYTENPSGISLQGGFRFLF